VGSLIRRTASAAAALSALRSAVRGGGLRRYYDIQSVHFAPKFLPECTILVISDKHFSRLGFVHLAGGLDVHAIDMTARAKYFV
jgi:hypothetical protein